MADGSTGNWWAGRTTSAWARSRGLPGRGQPRCATGSASGWCASTRSESGGTSTLPRRVPARRAGTGAALSGAAARASRGRRREFLSESRMREIRPSGSMSGEWKRSTAGLLRHRQTKGPATDRPYLNHRATPRLYSPKWVYGILGGYLVAQARPVCPDGARTGLRRDRAGREHDGAVAMWNFGPNWYPVALAVTALPYAWFGGLLERRFHG